MEVYSILWLTSACKSIILLNESLNLMSIKLFFKIYLTIAYSLIIFLFIEYLMVKCYYNIINPLILGIKE